MAMLSQSSAKLRMSLTELANHYKSDKGSEYKCAHNYTQHYEQIFAPYRDKTISLLEIGLNRDGASDVPSLRMYRDYFDFRTQIAGFDICPEFKWFSGEGFEIIIGDQSSPQDLVLCASKNRTIIIDDGSHASSHQQITLRELWKIVEPGGLYIIEDLHWQPFHEDCPKTVELARQWTKGEAACSEHMPQEAVKTLLEQAESITLLPSHSLLHDASLTIEALLVIRKKP